MTRKRVALLTGAAGLLVVTLFIALPSRGYQHLGMALAVALLAGGIGLSMALSQRQHRAVLRALTKVEKRVSRVEYRTQPVHDIRGTVVKSSAETHEALLHLRELVDHGIASTTPFAEGQGGYLQRPEGSLLAPEGIRASSIEGRPAMHMPGRDAARQQMDPSSRRNLARLLGASDAELQREIAFVGDLTLRATLEKVGSVTIVTPGMGEDVLTPTTSYLVIAVEGLATTPWRGALDASGTHLFRELRGLITAGRRRGIVVILQGEAVPSHFTASLEKLAHVVVKNGGVVETRWGDDVDSEVIKALTKRLPLPAPEVAQR